MDLADIAGTVVEEVAPAARRAGIKIHPPDLAPAATAGDPYLLERLVQNLVENAIRHNLPADGLLAVRTWSAGGRAILEVANTGQPVQPYETEAIFQPFQRLKGRRTAPERGKTDRGFGLGLSIVRALAAAHDGTVHASPGRAAASP